MMPPSSSSPSDAERDREARMRFMGITQRTGELLREFWQIAEPALPDILDGFYRHVTSERQLAALIGNDIPRLKKAQGTHWARLFNGRFDHEYMVGVRTIGMVHNKIGLEPRWYIGAYNFVLSSSLRWPFGAIAGRQAISPNCWPPLIAPSCSTWKLRFQSTRKPCWPSARSDRRRSQALFGASTVE